MTTPARATIDLAEIEQRAKAALGGEFDAVSPDVVLRLVAALRDLRDGYLGDGHGYEWLQRQHGITDEATP